MGTSFTSSLLWFVVI